jgi:hypothetical protein
LHHYVPQFHLRRFSDATGKIWAWDRERDRSFSTATKNVAAETQFYRLTEFESVGRDPLTMENQLADIEAEVSKITSQWLEWLPVTEPGGAIDIPAINREIVAQFVAIQHLRTADVRDILAAFASADEASPELSDDERRRLHVDLMWNMGVVSRITAWIAGCSWVFCVNETPPKDSPPTPCTASSPESAALDSRITRLLADEERVSVRTRQQEATLPRRSPDPHRSGPDIGI